MDLKAEFSNLISFIPARSGDDKTGKARKTVKVPTQEELDGSQAKLFYEDVINTASDVKTEKCEGSSSLVLKEKITTGHLTKHKLCYTTVTDKKETKKLCNSSVSDNKETRKLCNSTVSDNKEIKKRCNSTVSDNKETEKLCNSTVSDNKETKKLCNSTVSDNKETKKLCNSTVGDNKETEKLCNSTVTCSDNKETDTSASTYSPHVTRLTNELMKYAQDGDVRQLKRLIELGTPINAQDSYGWTAVMCAAFSGHLSIVQYLLEQGADIALCERTGKTAKALAKQAGNSDIAKVLEYHQKGLKQCEETNSSSAAGKKDRYCKICKMNYSDTTRIHEASTVHLFSTGKKTKAVPFFIPRSNVGYRLMLKKGWDGEMGLGPEGQGQKYPIKTVLKRDRSCIGAESKEKAKITHFVPNDVRAIKSVQKKDRTMSVRKLNKRALKAKEKKSREWEKNLRLYMNTD